MILAGGRGTRLLDLTSKFAKPAVYYGGKYRIIDFPLSNCANSNIGVVGVLTQYESVLLNAYTAQGSRWGIDGRDNGATLDLRELLHERLHLRTIAASPRPDAVGLPLSSLRTRLVEGMLG